MLGVRQVVHVGVSFALKGNCGIGKHGIAAENKAHEPLYDIP